MSDGLQPTPPFTSAALAASNVGVWVRDPEREVVYCDTVTSEIFGLGEAEGAAGVSLERLLHAVHPEDRMIHHREVLRARTHAGINVFEYRVATPAGGVRWVLVRGRYEAPRVGQALNAGRGIVIDVTESRRPGRVEERGPPVSGAAGDDGLDPIHRACDLAVALRRAIDALGEDVPGLFAAANVVLLILTRRLARDVPRALLRK